jgi:hypothetical protein
MRAQTRAPVRHLVGAKRRQLAGMDAADAGSRERGTTMRMKTLGEAALLLGLLLFGAANSSGTLQLIVQQIQEIRPRQWLQLMAGAMVLNNMALNKPAQFQNASFGAVSSSCSPLPGRRASPSTCPEIAPAE